MIAVFTTSFLATAMFLFLPPAKKKKPKKIAHFFTFNAFYALSGMLLSVFQLKYQMFQICVSEKCIGGHGVEGAQCAFKSL